MADPVTPNPMAPARRASAAAAPVHKGFGSLTRWRKPLALGFRSSTFGSKVTAVTSLPHLPSNTSSGFPKVDDLNPSPSSFAAARSGFPLSMPTEFLLHGLPLLLLWLGVHGDALVCGLRYGGGLVGGADGDGGEGRMGGANANVQGGGRVGGVGDYALGFRFGHGPLQALQAAGEPSSSGEAPGARRQIYPRCRDVRPPPKFRKGARTCAGSQASPLCSQERQHPHNRAALFSTGFLEEQQTDTGSSKA
ncbi:hypothetical protein ACP70R_016642 [Stipagrostis hirtigluma subsp. patula]